MPKLQRAKTVACGLLRWDRCCIIVVSHWSKPAGQNMASLLVVVGFRTSHSMPKEESHVIFSKNLPLKGGGLSVVCRPADGPDRGPPGRAGDPLGPHAAMGRVGAHPLALLDRTIKGTDGKGSYDYSYHDRSVLRESSC